MTNLVSCSASSAFHIWPELRIAAGIEASMMTSLGTCRLVMPRLESTCASAGPRSYAAAIAVLDRRAHVVGQLRDVGEHAAEALVRVGPDRRELARRSCSKTSAK